VVDEESPPASEKPRADQDLSSETLVNTDSPAAAATSESVEQSDAPLPEAPEVKEPEEPPGPAADRRRAPRGPRSELLETREPLFREVGGYRLRLDPPDLARMRELPGAKGKTDRELGEIFFDAQAVRLTAALAGDVAAPADVRVVVDPYSRQAFLAVGKTIRGIVSF
jgi:hypothetical protein